MAPKILDNFCVRRIFVTKQKEQIDIDKLLEIIQELLDIVTASGHKNQKTFFEPVLIKISAGTG